MFFCALPVAGRESLSHDDTPRSVPGGGNHRHIVITMRRRGAKSPARREIHSYESLIEIRHSLQLELRHASLLPLTIYLHYALRKAPRLTQFHLAKLCLLLIRDSYKRAKGGENAGIPAMYSARFHRSPARNHPFCAAVCPCEGVQSLESASCHAAIPLCVFPAARDRSPSPALPHS